MEGGEAERAWQRLEAGVAAAELAERADAGVELRMARPRAGADLPRLQPSRGRGGALIVVRGTCHGGSPFWNATHHTGADTIGVGRGALFHKRVIWLGSASRSG